MYDFDVIFIGSGHACNHAAITLALAGKRVAFAEQDLLAGTCTNYGCDAKILLDAPFELRDSFAKYQGLCAETPEIQWTPLMAYKKQVIGAFPAVLEQIFTQMGIAVLRGHGALLDAHTVQIGEQKATAEYIVLGTGQRPAELEIPGKEYLHDSREFLDLDVMPEQIIMIGAGIISMEFASIALSLGKKVTVIEFADSALRGYPAKYVNKIVQKMQQQGAVFHFGEAVVSAESAGSGVTVTTKSGLQVSGDYILNAAGRVCNVENLGLEALGIEASRRGIVVDDHLRTAVPNIFASGDVVDKTVPRLTPTAAFESDYIAELILGLHDQPIEYPAVPNLVFTLPRIAQAGITVAEAEAHPELYRTVSVPFGQQNLWLAKNEADIDITFILDAEKKLVGAAIYGSEAGTWIDLLTVIINQRLSAFELKKMIFAFPTTTYGLINALIPVMLSP